MTDIAAVLDQLTTGLISIRDAAERLGWLERGEATTCRSCCFFKADGCYLPNQPTRPEHPDSVRCSSYEYDDPRDYALPLEPSRRGGMMFK